MDQSAPNQDRFPQTPSSLPTPPQGPIEKRKIAIGLVAVVLLIIAAAELSGPSGSVTSGSAGTKAKKAVPAQPIAPADIGSFERQTNEEVQELARIEAQKKVLAETLATVQDPQNPGQPGPDLTTLEQQRLAAASGHYPASQAPSAASADQLAQERKRRAYESLYASNVALDLRSQATPAHSDHSGQNGPAGSGESSARTQNGSENTPVPASASSVSVSANPRNPYAFDSSIGKAYRLFEGTLIETVLTNRINGAFSGPVDAMVTTDVYSHDNQTLLIPQGSRLLGAVRAVANGQQQRLFVAFHRLIMPDGFSVSLDQFTGMNQIGETGLRDLVNHHYLQIFGASLALAAIGGVAQIGNGGNSFAYDPSVQFRNGISQSMAESSQRVLDHFLNQLPTFVVRERTRIKVYLADDLLVPAYSNHTMPRDL
jgi:type IV secretion system protein VirB10